MYTKCIRHNIIIIEKLEHPKDTTVWLINQTGSNFYCLSGVLDTLIITHCLYNTVKHHQHLGNTTHRGEALLAMQTSLTEMYLCLILHLSKMVPDAETLRIWEKQHW